MRDPIFADIRAMRVAILEVDSAAFAFAYDLEYGRQSPDRKAALYDALDKAEQAIKATRQKIKDL